MGLRLTHGPNGAHGLLVGEDLLFGNSGPFGWNIGAPILQYQQNVQVAGNLWCDAYYVIVLPDGSKHSFPPNVLENNCYSLYGDDNYHQAQPGIMVGEAWQDDSHLQLNLNTFVTTD